MKFEIFEDIYLFFINLNKIHDHKPFKQSHVTLFKKIAIEKNEKN